MAPLADDVERVGQSRGGSADSGVLAPRAADTSPWRSGLAASASWTEPHALPALSAEVVSIISTLFVNEFADVDDRRRTGLNLGLRWSVRAHAIMA
jgi:hypothetical protein